MRGDAVLLPEDPASCIAAPYTICLLEAALGTLGVKKLGTEKNGD